MVSSSIAVSYPETQVDDSDIFIPLEKQCYDKHGHEVCKEDTIEIILNSVCHVHEKAINDFIRHLGYKRDELNLLANNKVKVTYKSCLD
jgi:hypothetical protein